MSKYHERIAAIAGKHDWTDDKGIAAGVQAELKLKGYGTAFQAWRDGVPIDEAEARQAIVDEVTAPPVAEEYRQNIRKTMLEDREFFDNYGLTAEAEGTELIFEHGNFRHPVGLAGLELVVGAKEVERRRKRTPKKDEKKEERARKLRDKLDDTLATAEADYLAHANQCGYLVRNTTVRFFANIVGQRGCSTETHIQGITLPELQEFTDSAGRKTLAGVSTHVDTSLAATGDEEGAGDVRAVHSDFAKEIVDFLNLEWEVDVDALKRQHREAEANSGHRSIEHWGGDKETVLAKLIERRPFRTRPGSARPGKAAAHDPPPERMDPGEIEEHFELGYESNLL